MHGNGDRARLLGRIADLLEARGADPHRVRAYRLARRNILDSGESLQSLYGFGPQRVQAINGVLAGRLSRSARRYYGSLHHGQS